MIHLDGTNLLPHFIRVILTVDFNGFCDNDPSQGGVMAERAAITGALSLYLNFINLFTLLLQLLGQRD